MAGSERAELPLSDSAAAYADRLVCASTAITHAEDFSTECFFNRVDRTVLFLCTAAAASHCCMDDDRVSVNDRIDRQLHVLQPNDDLALLFSLGCEGRGPGAMECKVRRRCSRCCWISSASDHVRHCREPSGALEVDGFSRRNLSSCESLRAIRGDDHVTQGNCD